MPPQIFLSGHANSVLQKQAFIIYTNHITVLAEETVRHRPTLLCKRTTVRLAYKLLVSFAYLLATALSSHNDVTLYVTALCYSTAYDFARFFNAMNRSLSLTKIKVVFLRIACCNK